MSVLIIEVLPDGMIFAADRNITVTVRGDDGEAYQSQEIGTKILRWPHGRALIGAVGLAEIETQPIQEWLSDFVGDNVECAHPETVAFNLRDRLQAAKIGTDPSDGLIVEFGTFSTQDGVTVPQMWHVTNIHGMNERTGEYDPPRSDFQASERILGHHLKDVPPIRLREFLKERAQAHDPFWFHQSIELSVFNYLEAGIKAAFVALHQQGKLTPPQSLRDWEKYARMWILSFGAYFDAFFGPGQKYVGGGADVLSIPWPNK